MLTVIDPSCSVVPILVGTVTFAVVPVNTCTVSAAVIPKSPTQEYSRLICTGNAGDRVNVKLALVPSVIDVWSAEMEIARSWVESVLDGE